MTNCEALQEMVQIYKPLNKDWMGYKIHVEKSGKPKLTVHHIVEVKNGGTTEVDNLAILTPRGHNALNKLEIYSPTIYDEWQELFKQINALKEPITSELLAKRAYLLKKTKEFFGNRVPTSLRR